MRPCFTHYSRNQCSETKTSFPVKCVTGNPGLCPAEPQMKGAAGKFQRVTSGFARLGFD